MGKSKLGILVMLFAALAVVLAACGDDTDSAEPTASQQQGADDSADQAGPTKVEVVASEYKYDMPSTIDAGETEFTLVNEGKEPHMIAIARLKANAPPVEELVQMSNKESGKYLAEEIGATEAGPGATSKPLTADLKPGDYGVVCFFGPPSSKPHALLGMFDKFTVS
jgi:hypothetical protein